MEPGVVFEEERLQRFAVSGGSRSGITDWVVKNSGGAIKNKSQAQGALLGVVIICVVTSLFFIVSSSKDDAPPVRTPDQYLSPSA